MTQTENEIQAFFYERREVRVIERDGEPWFVAKDVSDILEYRTANDMTRNLDDDEVQYAQSAYWKKTHGGKDITLINESGVYHAVFQSRKEEAKAFRRWVTGEVLPALRKNGSYSLMGAQDRISAMREGARLLAEVTRLYKGGGISAEMAQSMAVGVFGTVGIPLAPAGAGKRGIRLFIDERLERAEDARVTWAELYEAFCDFMDYDRDDFGEPLGGEVLGRRQFTAEMRRAFGIRGANGDNIHIDGKSARGLKGWKIKAAETNAEGAEAAQGGEE